MISGFPSFWGVTAAVISEVAAARYVVSIVQGRIRPSGASWLAMAIVSGALTASYKGAGAQETIWLPLTYTVNCTVVAALTLSRAPAKWTRLDVGCLIGTCLGLLAWYLSGSPLLALAILIGTDALSFAPSMLNAWRHPEAENFGAWALTTLASAINLLALEVWNLPVAGYAIYCVLGNGFLTTLLAEGARRRAARQGTVPLT